MYGPSWNGSASSFSNANNYGTGCYAAQNNNPAACSDVMRQRMGEAWVDNLPHEYRGGEEARRAEQGYQNRVDDTFFTSASYVIDTRQTAPSGYRRSRVPGSLLGDEVIVPTLKNANPEQQQRFDDAYREMWRRLHLNDGDNDCAKLFGGLKTAEQALMDTKFSVGALKSRDAGAETKGNKVTIGHDQGFFDTSGSFPIPAEMVWPGPGQPTGGSRSITLENVEAAAFMLLHELGHRTGKLEDDAGDAIESVRNSSKIREACFK